MAGGPVNATRFLERKGIQKGITYAAKVVNNVDPRKLCRIQARIEGIMDEIPDGDLPWAVPQFKHPDGAFGASGWERSGMAWVPKPESKIGLKFMSGDPHRPTWCEYPIDENHTLPENTELNYPDRMALRLKYGFSLVIDTRTNEVIVHNNGNTYMTVLGNCHQTVIGNMTHTIGADKGKIPSYLTNLPGCLSDVQPHPRNTIPWKGLTGGPRPGSWHNYIDGDYTMEVKGNRKVLVHQNDELEVKLNRTEKIGMLHRIEALRSETNG